MGTYIPLAKTVLTGTASSVSFSAIAGTYTDLIIQFSVRGDRAVTVSDLFIRLNGTTANYSDTQLLTDSTGVASYRNTGNLRFENYFAVSSANATSSTFTSGELYVANYAGATNKQLSLTVAAENNSATAGAFTVGNYADLWRNTAAITQIEFLPYSGNFVSGSRFDLYGII